MYSRDLYEINQAGMIGVLEDLSTKCIDPAKNIFTMKGFAAGISAESLKILVPFVPNPVNDHFPYVRSGNGRLFQSLAEGIQQVQQRNELGLKCRFDMGRLLQESRFGEGLSPGILGEHQLPNQGDDLFWHLNINYRNWVMGSSEYRAYEGKDLMVLSINDNSDISGPASPRFREFCQKMFGNVVDKYATQKLPILASE